MTITNNRLLLYRYKNIEIILLHALEVTFTLCIHQKVPLSYSAYQDNLLIRMTLQIYMSFLI